MKVESIGYLSSLSTSTVINCGKNFELYKLITLIEVFESVFAGGWQNGQSSSAFEIVVDRHLSAQKVLIQPDIFKDGINCEILDTNFKEWKKGKLRAKLILEFVPDPLEITEPESPLDEIRREIQASQLS